MNATRRTSRARPVRRTLRSEILHALVIAILVATPWGGEARADGCMLPPVWGEIYEHTQRIGQYFDLYDNAIFQTRVTETKWLEDEQRWQVSTHRNDNIKAQFVIQATGPANRPRARTRQA